MGSNPKLHLELGANGPGTPTFNIDYANAGDIPCSGDYTKQWVAWNVKDENGHYYGTINLKKSDCTQVLLGHYDGGPGYWLEGITLTPYQGTAYQLKCTGIHLPGPFPDAPLATPAVYSGTSDRIVLSVSGDKIVNNRGKTVSLKGLCRPSLEWNKYGQYLNPLDIVRLCHWHNSATCNAIRVSLCQELWFASGDKTVKGSYKQIIDAIIYYAIKEKMAVILDLHKLVVAVDGPNMANSQSKQFWAQVAAEYKDFGTVLFELFNEPHDIAQDTWLNGDKDKDYAGYQQLFKAVRDTGAKNICLVSGLDWAYDLSFVNDKFPAIGDNIIYCSHPYYPKGNDAGGKFSPASNFAGVLGKFPVIFTEFGANQAEYYDNGHLKPYAFDYYTQVISYMNTNGFHYTGWAWWVENDHPWWPTLISDWEGYPWNGGELVHKDIRLHPGTPIDSV
jgi:hypothetical protein